MSEYRLEMTEDPDRPAAIFRAGSDKPVFTFGPNDHHHAQKTLANLNGGMPWDGQQEEGIL